MGYREQDSKNSPSRDFHPLLFAVTASILVLLITAIISILSYPHLSLSSPFRPAVFSLNAVKKSPWIKIAVQKGDNLQKIFLREKLDTTDYTAITLLPDVKKTLQNPNPNQPLYLLLNKQRRIQQLVYMIDHENYLHVYKTKKRFQSTIVSIKLTEKMLIAKGVIHQSFNVAAHRAGLSNTLTTTMTTIFGWDINFSHGIQPNDKFIVIYDAFFDHGKEVKSGNIVAAEFTNHNKKYYAIRYDDGKKSNEYFRPTGQNIRSAFLRAPIKYRYISSPFNAKRMHPILHIIRPHEGVDLAAPTGTPIHASSDGTITFRGRRGGYGKCIMMQNGLKYSTLFAHMSRFSTKYRVGSRVQEGQVIGYVGQTGLATGPHLHYEFHINGVPYDPMKVKLPNASPVPKKELPAYLVYAKQMVTELNEA